MLDNIKEALRKYNKKLWVMYNVENCDRLFYKYISKDLFTSSICMVTCDDVFVIVSELDLQNVEKLKYNNKKIHILVYKNREELDIIIEEIIAKLKFVNDISLSYSTISDKNVDILTHGDYVYLTKLLKKPYKKYAKKVRFTSAEKIIYYIESKKTPLQLKRLKQIAYITDEILATTFKRIKKGMTEIEIVEFTNQITKEITDRYINNNDMVFFDMAWENCPIVLIGENLKKGGHSLPSNKVLCDGETIYFDFGLEVVFSDGMKLYSDLQRMGYALKKGEIKAPHQVQNIFDTLVYAIEDGIEELKPKVKGYTIDSIVREKIKSKGYPDYNHATGHSVGISVHDIGAVISTKASKRANLELVEDGVYTLEPRISVVNGGSIEEMIQVTKFGGIPLSPLQKSIYLIK